MWKQFRGHVHVCKGRTKEAGTGPVSGSLGTFVFKAGAVNCTCVFCGGNCGPTCNKHSGPRYLLSVVPVSHVTYGPKILDGNFQKWTIPDF